MRSNSGQHDQPLPVAHGRADAGETAFSQRSAAHNVNINAVWTGDDPEAVHHITRARDFFDAMQPHAGGHVYLNFLGDEGADRVRQAATAWALSS